MIQSVYGGSLLERVKRHRQLLGDLRGHYISERRRRPDEQLVSHAVSCQLLNVANIIESAEFQLTRLALVIEEEEVKAMQPQAAEAPQAEEVQP